MHNSNRNHLPASNPLPGSGPLPTYGDSPASGPAKHTAGHHRHDVLNKMDPSVDSSRDKVAMPQPGTATNGPHSSRLANKLDPTVDTSLYESRNLAAGVPQAHKPHHQGGMVSDTTAHPHGATAGAGYGHASHGVGAGHASHGVGAGGLGHSTAPGMGPMGAGYAQQHHAGQHVGVGHLPGPAPNTAGPHKSDLMNKLDPSVDHKGGMGQQRRI